MANLNYPFGASATRRPPTSGEAADGYGCGDADKELFDFLAWYQMGQIASAIAAAGLTPADNDLTQLFAAIKLMSVRTVKRTLISATGTYTPTTGMRFADVELQGGGGGGGGAFGATSPTVSAAPGGGGGGYTRKLFTAAQIGANAAVVIGAGGAGGAAGQNNGTAGGNSTFDPAGTGATLTASGGGQGIFGTTATFPTRGTSIGAGGAGSNGDFNINGQPSGWPLLFGGSDSYTAISGHGGDSYFGRGGQASQENNAGNVGNGYGAGGGGGAALTTSTAGGNGTPGVCIITEYIQDA